MSSVATLLRPPPFALVSISTSLLVLLLERLHHNRAQHCIDHMDHGQGHGDSRHPASLVLQNPRQLLHAAVNVRISGDRVTALLGQGVPVQDKVIGPISATAADLGWGRMEW